MEIKLTENEELKKKIINYLEKLEENQLAQKLVSKKRFLLLTGKKEYDKINKSQKDYQELVREVEEEERGILFDEIKKLEEEKDKIIKKIKEQIIEEEGTKQNIVMEIRPGAGGTEAGLFARDLYRMYCKFAEGRG